MLKLFILLIYIVVCITKPLPAVLSASCNCRKNYSSKIKEVENPGISHHDFLATLLNYMSELLLVILYN